MRPLRTWQVGLRIMLASSMLGTLFQGGCLGGLARNFNPCGTILACDPVEWDLMFHDYPDYDIDPTCTIPGLCGGQWPPGSDGGAVGDGGAVVTTPITGGLTGLPGGVTGYPGGISTPGIGGGIYGR